MKVTVLTAIYNGEKYLRQCLDSLKAQTLTECQFLCIDDGSTDHSADIVLEYYKSDSRFFLFQTLENRGQAAARNIGLSLATGEYITMLDADDWLAPDALEKAYQTITETPQCDCAVFNVVLHEETNGQQSPYPLKNCQPVMDGQEAFRLSLDWSLHGYYLIRRSIHLRYPYDTSCRLYSDDNTTRIHFLHSRRVALTEGTYYYRQHAESLTHRYTPMRFLFMDAYSSMKAQILEEIKVGNIQQPAQILTFFENQRWINYLSMVRYYLEYRHRMSKDEKRSIEHRLKEKLKTFETDKIERRFKRRFGYMPIKCWPLFRLQAVVFHYTYPIYAKLRRR